MTDGAPDVRPDSAGRPSQASYEIDGHHVVPTELASGPWYAEQQHGACLLGLLTRFMEQVPVHQPMRFTRVTADLSRAVPMRPITVTARALRDGRRVQSLEALLSIDGDVLSRATATRIRVEPGLVPAAAIPSDRDDDAPPPFPPSGTGWDFDRPTFHDCLEVRTLESEDRLEARTWFRLAAPLVAGEEPSPTVRIASIADMTISAGGRLGSGWVSINPEVSLQIEREPEGEWICVSSVVRFTDDGVGMSEGVLHDLGRRIGRTAKSLLNHRPG